MIEITHLLCIHCLSYKSTDWRYGLYVATFAVIMDSNGSTLSFSLLIWVSSKSSRSYLMYGTEYDRVTYFVYKCLGLNQTVSRL